MELNALVRDVVRRRIAEAPEFQLSNSQAVSRPSASTPAFTSITPAGRK